MHGRGICAARDRTGDTAAFQTNGHCFLLPQHLRAAKWHFYPDTTRPRTARFKNQNPARGRKHDETVDIYEFVDDLRTRTPQGDGVYLQPPLPERGERSTSSNHTSLTLVFLGRFPIRPVTQSAAPKGLLLGQVSRGTA